MRECKSDSVKALEAEIEKFTEVVGGEWEKTIIIEISADDYSHPYRRKPMKLEDLPLLDRRLIGGSMK